MDITNTPDQTTLSRIGASLSSIADRSFSSAEVQAVLARKPAQVDLQPYLSALSQCASLLDNMSEGDPLLDTPKFLAKKLAALEAS